MEGHVSYAPTASPSPRLSRVPRRAIAVFLSDPRALVGVTLLLLYILIALVGSSFSPYDTTSPNIAIRMQGPTWEHPFGTDRIGRDVATRIIAGSRVSLQVAAGAVIVALLLGAPLGALASYVGGTFDALVQRVMEGIRLSRRWCWRWRWWRWPGRASPCCGSPSAFSSIPRFARIVRSGVLTHKQREYVEAARAMGQRPMGVLAKQILPNIMAPIAVQITLDFARAIGVEAALSYLGLGLAAPYISWGLMVREALDFLEVAPWLAVFRESPWRGSSSPSPW